MDYQIKNYIIESFNSQRFLLDFNAKLTNLAHGCAQIEVPVTDRMHNQHGFAHAGILFSLGDTAAGYAALTCLSVGQEIMTVEFKVNYLEPVKGKKIRAVGKVIRPGRRLIIVSSVLYSILEEDYNEKKIAIMQGTMLPTKRLIEPITI